MRLDIKREEEVAKRKGLAFKTILATFWLALCFVVAYLITGWLERSGTVTVNLLYNYLFIPRTVDPVLIRIGFMVLIVIVMQLFILIGFAFGSPAGRRRPGTPKAYSTDPDPLEGRYDYRR